MPAANGFDDQLLSDYATRFSGYGNYQGAYWFVGIEEGGGASFQEVSDAVVNWDTRGRRELEDLYECQDPAGWRDKLFGDRARLQPTWNKLIRVLLSAEQRDDATEAVRPYQRKQLGRKGGETCLLELLPLPSPSGALWLYGERSHLPQLQTRDAYLDYYAPRRSEQIRKLIAKHHPEVVVFYGGGPFLAWWKKIAGVDFTPNKIGKLDYFLGRSDSTVFAITRHPAAFGVTNAYVQGVGKEIRSLRLKSPERDCYDPGALTGATVAEISIALGG